MFSYVLSSSGPVAVFWAKMTRNFPSQRALHLAKSAQDSRKAASGSFQPLVGFAIHGVLGRMPSPVIVSVTSLPSSRVAEADRCSADTDGNDLPPPELVVASFYAFSELPNCDELRPQLQQLCHEQVHGQRGKTFQCGGPAHDFQERVSGGIIVAPEGVNGSICGAPSAVAAVLAWLRSAGGASLPGLRVTEAPAALCAVPAPASAGPSGEAGAGRQEAAAGEEAPGPLTGHSALSPLAAGPDAPFRWEHVRVKRKEELVVDVRNAYEVRVGRFRRALDPRTSAFREFPAWLRRHRHLLPRAQPEGAGGRGQEGRREPGEAAGDGIAAHAPAWRPSSVEGLRGESGGAELQLHEPEEEEDAEGEETGKALAAAQVPVPRRVAMYCTGGIRCEKATALLVQQGVEEVYHLDGGILNYLKQVPEAESLWEGECFVFDKRVTVGQGLSPGSHRLCYACKEPVTEEDTQSPLWETGVSCPHCFNRKTAEERARARARQEQVERWGRVGGPKGSRQQAAERKLKNKTERLRLLNKAR